MKRIITCSDGTWNMPNEKDRGTVALSNVCDFYNLLPKQDRQGIVQMPFYDPGVGTGDWYDKITGGIIGAGINQNIKDAYRFIALNYEPGDEIYLLGFSRGAYTARSVAGFIYNCGIVKNPTEELIDNAFALYRRRDIKSHPWAKESVRFRSQYSHPLLPIKFVGVWDTVGALGIPGKIFEKVNKDLLRCEFHDVQLSSLIENAYHAVAIDEHRVPFEPTLWCQTDSGIAAGQKMEQKWFPGVHSDVGGSYRERGLSDAALRWMIEKASALGLAFKDYNCVRPNAEDVMHDSMSFLYRLSGVFTPFLALIGIEKGYKPKGSINRKIGNGQRFNESIAASAAERWNNNTDNYRRKANPYLRRYMKRR